MREFETGATRDTDIDKLDYAGFFSSAVMQEYARYMHMHRIQADGKLRASDNWKKGIPKEEYIKSLFRHFMDLYLEHEGHESREGIKSALCGIMFNVNGYMLELLKDEQKPHVCTCGGNCETDKPVEITTQMVEELLNSPAPDDSVSAYLKEDPLMRDIMDEDFVTAKEVEDFFLKGVADAAVKVCEDFKLHGFDETTRPESVINTGGFAARNREEVVRRHIEADLTPFIDSARTDHPEYEDEVLADETRRFALVRITLEDLFPDPPRVEGEPEEI
jgi:hypothetical protein